MFKVKSDPGYVVGTRYQVVAERVVATGMLYSEAYTVVELLNAQAESKTPTPCCPECGGPITGSGGHGDWCPNQSCKWGWEMELDGSPLKPPTPSFAEQKAANAKVNRQLDEIAAEQSRIPSLTFGHWRSCPFCLAKTFIFAERKP